MARPSRDRGLERRRVGEQAPGCSRRVGDCSTCSTGPSSTIRPALMTATRWAIERTSGRLCVTNSIASPSSRCSSAEQLHDGRLHAHVERRGDLVADQDGRADDQGARDGDALALAARELVGVAVDVARGQRDAVEHLLDPLVGLGSGRGAEDAERLAHDLPDRLARVERAVRVLEDVLDRLPRLARAAARAVGERLAAQRDQAGAVAVQARDRAGQRGLARSRTRRPGRGTRAGRAAG